MKKNRILIIAICSILLLLMLFSVPQIWNSFFVMELNDIDEYINNKYIDYNHGEISKSFFDEYVCLGEYIDAAFHFCDGEKMIVFGYNRQFVKTMYVLDVCYEEDSFNAVLNKFTNDKQFIYLDHRNPNTGYGFEEYCIVNDTLEHSNSAASVFIDSYHKTIRYAFVYDKDCGSSIAYDIALTLDIPENSNKNDLIFDYSKIN